MNSARPFPPGDRTVAGAWEGDLIMGRHNRSAIGTLVERTTRYTMLLQVDAARRSVTTRDALITALGTLPAQLRTSLTLDQGWEPVLHEQITAALGTKIYFCDPHSPWQRGTNENTSRLLRDYFPKRTDLSIHTPQRLADVAAELNDRPREVPTETPRQPVYYAAERLPITRSVATTVRACPVTVGSNQSVRVKCQ